MNGRLYDPVLGRMLSPDPHIQMPDFSQNFNWYSYCFNNPLKYTDPDGEWVFQAAMSLGFMYLGGMKANNWERNPIKWNWKTGIGEGNTYGALWNGFQMGISIGSMFEANYSSIKMNGSGGSPGSQGRGGFWKILGAQGYHDYTTYADYYAYPETGTIIMSSKNIIYPDYNYLGEGLGVYLPVNGRIGFFSGLRSIVENSHSAIWNSRIVKAVIKDRYTMKLNYNIVPAFFGAGGSPIEIHLMTRGPESGLFFTTSISHRYGEEVDAGIEFGYSNFRGAVEDMRRSTVYGKYQEFEVGWFVGASGSVILNDENNVLWTGVSGGAGYTFGASYGRGMTYPWF